MQRARWLWFALVLAFWLRPARAESELALLPSLEGHLGAWLVSGPLSKAQAARLARAATTPTASAEFAASSRLLATADGAIDLKTALNVGADAGPYAVARTTLELAETCDVWLLIAADGGVSVSVDTKVVFQRDVRRLRGNSWDPLRLTLEKGRHTLTLALHHTGEHWAFAARVLDTRDLLPPPGMQQILVGLEPTQASALTEQLTTAKLDLALTSSGYRPRLTLEFRRGLPASAPLPVELELGGPLGRSLRLGEVPLAVRGTSSLVAELPELRPAPELDGVQEFVVRVRLGRAQEKVAVLWHSGGPELKRRADTLLTKLALSSDPARAELDSTLRWHLSQLEQALEPSPAAANRVRDAATRLSELLSLVERDNLAEGIQAALHTPGIRNLALSSVDGRPDQLRVHVPGSYERNGQRRYPVTLLLHGYKGTPESVLDAFLDSHSLAAHPAVDGFLLAPAAHGDTFYRGPGETAVMAALAWALKTYPIDAARVSITGVSMGGTGAAQIALRYPQRFSAAAPLAGYQSYFIRRDIAGLPLRAWERHVMHHWSPASWAEMGAELPLYVAHGTDDKPLENSRVLVRRYQNLGLNVTQSWPETGHAVWLRTYAHAGLWPWLARWQRAPQRTRLSVQSDLLRYATRDWLTLRQFTERGPRGRVTASLEGALLKATTHNVDAFALDRGGAGTALTHALVDGDTLELPPAAPIELSRINGHWQLQAPPAAGSSAQLRASKHAASEGPIHDAFLGPMLFVFGSGSASSTRVNREIARAFATPRYGANLEYRVIADVALSPQDSRSHNLFLVGNAADNSVLARCDAALPIHANASGVTVGTETFQGPNAGALFVYPNPEAPEHYVVVLTAPDPSGLWQALALPELLPDFVIFDQNVAAASGRKVLGAASVRAAGFFDNTWQFPSSVEH